MELEKYRCRQLMEKENCVAQIALDDDFIVRDNKPDVEQVIYAWGNMMLEDVKTGSQGVWITGKLRFSALYQSDDESHKLDSVSGEVPFQEKVVLDLATEDAEVEVDLKVEDLSVGIINSRKLAIRAVVLVKAKSVEEQELALCRGIGQPGKEQKTKELSTLCLVERKREQIRLQRELLLPNSRSNIGQMVFYQVDFRNEEVALLRDCAQVKLEAQIWVLYRSESNGEYECFETVVPFSADVDLCQLRGDEVFWAKIQPLEITVEPRSDYDGESRMLGVDLSLGVELQVYREESCQLLEDAYALDRELFLTREEVPLAQLLMKNVSKVRLLEQEKLEPNQKRILQICGSSGSVTIDRVQKRENGLYVEGVLNVHILYTTTDDTMPYAHTSCQIPFEQTVEVEGPAAEYGYWVCENIEQLQVNLLDASEYEVKALVQIAFWAWREETVSNIISLEEQELDEEILRKQPGMIGYMRREGEDLWDVAKKYHVSMDRMIEIQDKVLITKVIGAF